MFELRRTTNSIFIYRFTQSAIIGELRQRHRVCIRVQERYMYLDGLRVQKLN